jgi:hypothetical protein
MPIRLYPFRPSVGHLRRWWTSRYGRLPGSMIFSMPFAVIAVFAAGAGSFSSSLAFYSYSTNRRAAGPVYHRAVLAHRGADRCRFVPPLPDWIRRPLGFGGERRTFDGGSKWLAVPCPRPKAGGLRNPGQPGISLALAAGGGTGFLRQTGPHAIVVPNRGSGNRSGRKARNEF